MDVDVLFVWLFGEEGVLLRFIYLNIHNDSRLLNKVVFYNLLWSRLLAEKEKLLTRYAIAKSGKR